MENRNDRYRRPGTRFSKNGRTAFVRLRIDRRCYEFARAWAGFHAPAFPAGTAEDQLEGYLISALLEHMAALDWKAPPEIDALYPQDRRDTGPKNDIDDGIPF